MRALRPLSLTVLYLLGMGVLAMGAFYVGVATRLTPPQELIDENGSGVQILDRNGVLLFELAGPDGGVRTPVALDEVSSHLINATVATEDADFWSNPGVNFRGLARAVYENVAFWEHGGFFRGPGGSSITQQLAKNLYVPPEDRVERSLPRKLKEMVMAFELNRRYSKEEILEWYLNEIFYGNSAYGVEAAATRYFDKHASELTLAEAALIAGIPKAPAVYDPISNFQATKARQEQVLELMVRHGHITAEEAQAAKTEPLVVREGRFPIRAPHFVMYVRELLPELLEDGARDEGLRVVTSLDVSLQAKAEEAVADHLAELQPDVGASNAALVAMDPDTGQLLAMVGSRDYFDESIDGQVNNALALNQPGSTVKPITYLAAFLEGWSPATIVEDRPIPFTDGTASFALQNADGRYRGSVSVREALANSLNVPAVRALEFAGLSDVHELARRMGLTTLQDVSEYGLAFTLGGADVTLLDMTFAYSVLANSGEQAGMPTVLDLPDGNRVLDPVAVLRVEDANGNVLWQHSPKQERVVPAPHAYLVTNILSDDEARAQMFGLDSPLELPEGPAAVKTGLSDGARDAWSIGYTPQLVAGVWVGNADNSAMPGATSTLTAAPIWHNFMAAALADQPVVPFETPDGVETVDVCASTGLLPSRRCEEIVTEVFLSGLEPQTSGVVVFQESNDKPTNAAPSSDEDTPQKKKKPRGRGQGRNSR